MKCCGRSGILTSLTCQVTLGVGIPSAWHLMVMSDLDTRIWEVGDTRTMGGTENRE